MKITIQRVSIFFLLFSLLALSNGALVADAATESIGKIAVAKGVATARSDARELTALAKGSPVYVGDVIETASRSFAVIKFDDGGKVTLRPDSRFDIKEYDGSKGNEKQSFELLKGGLRAVTGTIGKAKPENVNYKARNTTIGIRGTEFIVKICGDDLNGCKGSSPSDSGEEIQAESKFVDIFVVDKRGGTRQKITRQQLQDILDGIYVSVIQGAINVDTGDKVLDMSAGDKCVVDNDDPDAGLQSSASQVECFQRGPSVSVENTDVFLSEAVEEITEFNLFDDSEVYVGDEICEIN